MAERGAPIGNPAPFAARAIVEGKTATEALRELRESGAGISTQRWYRVYGETQAAIENRETAATLDILRTPGAEQWTEWETRAEGYMYQFRISAWDAELGTMVTREASVFRTQPVPTIDAMQQAQDEFVEGNTVVGTNPLVFQGAVLSGLFQMTGTMT
jgi:hypothetical protein